jgi:hypothetical protein
MRRGAARMSAIMGELAGLAARFTQNVQHDERTIYLPLTQTTISTACPRRSSPPPLKPPGSGACPIGASSPSHGPWSSRF